jgi:DNA-binding FrmR family transcriptional regulator
VTDRPSTPPLSPRAALFAAVRTALHSAQADIMENDTQQLIKAGLVATAQLEREVRQLEQEVVRLRNGAA